MIKFKYKIPDNLIPLMRSEFLDYYDDYLIGYLPEELTGVLEHCSLYLVCNEQEHSGNVITYHDPIVIVAKNQCEVSEYYNTIVNTKGILWRVHSELQSKCNKLVVEPLE